MTKRSLLLMLSLVLALTISLGSTLAYLTDTDADVNVMTLGNVDILQNEQQWNEDATELEEFENDKPLYPYVGTLGWDKTDDENGAYRVFTMENVVDKYVTVTNTGKSDAYVRTIIAAEMGEYETVEEFRNKIVGFSRNVENGDEFKFPGAWVWDDFFVAEIDGHNYMIMVATHQEAVKPEETTIPSLLQIYMNKDCGNEEVEKLDGNGNGKYDVLVLSQAVQTAGFDSAEEALNEAFPMGDNNANVPGWFTGWTEDDIGSPGDEWLNNNPPLLESWADSADTSWYNDTDTEFTLDTAEELAGLAELVNNGNNFAGKTIMLGDDIDLGSKKWVPIGALNHDHAGEGSFSDKAAFKGSFDGQKNTISNLTIFDDELNGAGLFALAQDATIENINLENVYIQGDSAAAAIVAKVNGKCNISNCHVTGDINIVCEWAYVAGIAAYGTANITDCSVIADDTGVITSKNRNAVGGIMGWMNNGNVTVANCEVKNVDLTGYANIGGLVGFLHPTDTIDGCSVENVNLTKTRLDGIPSIGTACGGWLYNATSKTTIKNNEFKNITLNGQSVPYDAANTLFGSEYYAKTDTSNIIRENNTESNITNNLIVVNP